MNINANIRIGPAGWHYKDWYGYVYPETGDTNFKELDYLCQFVDTAEINSTFYRPANSFMASAWVRKVAHNPGFLFTAKLWNRFTHNRSPYTNEDVEYYLQGIDPLMEANKLGALLFQFPWSFKNSGESRKYLLGLFQAFSDYPIVLEVRHITWDHDSVYAFLDKSNVSIAAIDQPVIGKSIPLEPVQTGTIGYVRLHGRNYKHWFSKESQKKENGSLRYDYLYSQKEIDEIAEVVKKVSQKSETTFAIQNNHPRGQAIANGFQLAAALGATNIQMPDLLTEHYSELKTIG